MLHCGPCSASVPSSGCCAAVPQAAHTFACVPQAAHTFACAAVNHPPRRPAPAQVALAVAICIIVGVKLQDVSYDSGNFNYSCLLGELVGACWQSPQLNSFCTQIHGIG